MSTRRSFRELASVLVVSIVGVCAVGCGTRSAPAPVLPAPPKVTKATAAKPVDPPIAAPAAPIQSDAKSAPAPSDSAKAAVAVQAAEPPPPTFSTERVLLLTPQNPLIVEIQFSIDGLPHTQALAQLVEEVLKIADTDGDGRPTWKEVVESKRFKYGQFGNVAINNENDLKQVLERYDSDRDSAVDAAELPRFLTRNAGSARAFSVRGLADFTSGSRASPL